MSVTQTAAGRVNALLDANSFVEIGAKVTARATDFDLKQNFAPSDGVVTGYGSIEGKPVYVFSQDAAVLGGSIGEMHAKKITGLYDLALKTGTPVVGIIDSTGVRLQESTDALNALAEIYSKQAYAKGVVLQIMAVFGNCGGGLSVVPALSDFAFIETEKGRMFVNSPDAICGNRVEKCDSAAADFQSEHNGCIDFAGSEEEIFDRIRTLINILPQNNEGDVYTSDCEDDLNRACESMDTMAADPRYLLAELSDSHIFVETKASFAKNMVTGFIQLNGMTIGAVANCAKTYDENGDEAEDFGKRLTPNGCRKAAEFVSFCDAFDIPVLSVTNTTGFATTMCAEKNLAKDMAKLTAAFANADVPKVNLITEEAYGSAYVVMNSKSVGADLVYAWNGAKVGMMDSEMAAKIMYPQADATELKEKRNEYEALCANASAAASRGYVDFMLEPADTRKYLVAAFELLYSKCISPIDKKHTTK